MINSCLGSGSFKGPEGDSLLQLLEITNIYGMHRIYEAFLKGNSVRELRENVTFYIHKGISKYNGWDWL